MAQQIPFCSCCYATVATSTWEAARKSGNGAHTVIWPIKLFSVDSQAAVQTDLGNKQNFRSHRLSRAEFGKSLVEHSVVSEEIALTREICRILTTSTFARTFLTFDPEDNSDSRTGLPATVSMEVI